MGTYLNVDTKALFPLSETEMLVCFYTCVWKQPTFSSSVISFSDTGEVGLFFMKSLKLLDRCRESCKHKQNARFFFVVQDEKSDLCKVN